MPTPTKETTVTTTRTIDRTETIYEGEVVRVHWTDGERSDFDVNADNPEKRWVVRERFTVCGQRAESFRDTVIPGFTFPVFPRASAHRTMLLMLADRGIVPPTVNTAN